MQILRSFQRTVDFELPNYRASKAYKTIFGRSGKRNKEKNSIIGRDYAAGNYSDAGIFCFISRICERY